MSLDYPPCTRTLGSGHQGPCPTVAIASGPSPAVIAAYERAINGVEIAVLNRVPRWVRTRGLDDYARRALAELFAEAHTIAQEANR